MSITCPKCFSRYSKVLHTRDPIVWRGKTIIYRERQCQHCGVKFRSKESFVNEEGPQPTVEPEPAKPITTKPNPFLPPS